MITTDDADLHHCRLLTIRQAADAMQVDRTTVYRLSQVVEDPLPVVRFGKRMTRIPLVEFSRWLERRKARYTT